jgi:nucleotide-binding universal stress UspA family protein
LPVPTTEALPLTGAGDQTTPLLPRGVAIKRVIVPLSGAPFAERALPHARAVARLTGATLVLVHVGDPLLPSPAALLERAVDTVIPTADQHDQTEDDEESLRLLRARGAPTTAPTQLLDLSSGSVPQGLLDLEALDGTDIVVLATRRHPGAEGDTLGTVARALIRRGRAPVLLICPQIVVPEHAVPALGRILVPLDGSALAEHALAPLFALAGGTRPDATVGEGVREIVLFSVIDSWRRREDAVRYLNRTGHVLQSALGEQVQIGVTVELGSAPGAIVAAAARGGPQTEGAAPFDLVALATPGRGGIKH